MAVAYRIETDLADRAAAYGIVAAPSMPLSGDTVETSGRPHGAHKDIAPSKLTFVAGWERASAYRGLGHDGDRR